MKAEQDTKNKKYMLVNAIGTGTVLAHKLFAVGLAYLYVDEGYNLIAEVSGSELCRLFRTTNSLYERIEALCDRQIRGATIFDWNLVFESDESGKLEAHQIVVYASMCRGLLTMRYNNYLTDKIVDLKKGFDALSLSEMLSLNNAYSIRLYKMLMTEYEYQKAKHEELSSYTIEYNLVELQLLLGIITINKEIKTEFEKDSPDYEKIGCLATTMENSKQYRSYSDFKRVVLSKVKQELNVKTSVSMDYEAIRNGKRVLGVRFFINNKSKESGRDYKNQAEQAK